MSESNDATTEIIQFGLLAKKWANLTLPLVVLTSASGFYIGTYDTEHGPVSRESEEYYKDSDTAWDALKNGTWTQRPEP